MPIYEFYCPENNRIYQFYARSLAQGRIVPKCPDNPKYHMRKALSAFAVGGAPRVGGGDAAAPAGGPADERMEAAMGAMEREFSSVDEKDPRAMGRMMRRMAELTGERIGGGMEEVVRKLEEGADPDSLDEQLAAEPGEGGSAPPDEGPRQAGGRRRAMRAAPVRDPKLYEYT